MPEAKPTTVSELMAKVGYLLLYWGLLEDEIRKATLAMGREPMPLSAHGQLWKAWVDENEKTLPLTPPQRDLLERLKIEYNAVREIRNALAHGLSNASTDPTSKEEPHVTYIDFDGSSRTLSYVELDDAVQRVDRCRRQIMLFPRPLP